MDGEKDEDEVRIVSYLDVINLLSQTPIWCAKYGDYSCGEAARGTRTWLRRMPQPQRRRRRAARAATGRCFSNLFINVLFMFVHDPVYLLSCFIVFGARLANRMHN